MKVFLGGTCAGYDWRKDLIPLLNCDYYNPVVEDWTEEDRLREVQERETAAIVLYVITKDMKGVYSIAEVVDDCNKRPRKTVFCNLYNEGDALKDDEKQMYHSLKAVEGLLSSNKVLIFYTLEKVAMFLNIMNDAHTKRRYNNEKV